MDYQLNHQKIFSTQLFVVDDFLNNFYTTKMKKYILDLWNKRDYDNNWQTKSADLHKKKEFKEFSELIIENNKKIIDILKYDVANIVITDMWANVLKPGESHSPHTHSNNYLSGVYYLYSDEAAGITFQDPRPAADVLVPRKKEVGLNNSNLAFYTSKINRAIIFPSWLMHWVPVNKSIKNRISVSWNIQLRGQLGEHHEFQSANF